MIKRANNMVIGIYFHPEAYPPTLNAIGELSQCFDHITIIHRPHLHGTWKYPSNVNAKAAGNFVSSKNQETSSLPKKISYFAGYILMFLQQCIHDKPTIVLVYDSMSLYAYHLVKRLLPFKHKVWYHNHDVVERQSLRKYSIGWFAAGSENKAFKYLDIFSLPTNDRLPYFPMKDFKGKYFFIPNYPSRKFYNQFYFPHKLEQIVRLIFQGQVGPLHGIEEIIPLLMEDILGHSLELVLKGPCMADYRAKVLQHAVDYNVSSRLTFLGVTPYADVPVASSNCDIGIGILAKKDIMNTTLGTASNKLYEYAAVGLPVIYYNSDNFTRYLSKFPWAIPADLSTDSIREVIKSIIINHSYLSAQAHSDFDHELNYEKGFAEMKNYLNCKFVSIV